MKFDIARQPLIPAFLTLAALAVTAMCCAEAPAAGAGYAVGIAAGADAGVPGLAVPPFEELLLRFQTAFPVWSRIAGCLILLFTGMSTGRLTVRYNLFSVGSCLSIPLYGIIACGIGCCSEYLSASVASALLILAIKHFCRSFSNGYGFDALFRASSYLSLLILVRPEALPLLMMLPLAVMLFRRTMRETLVAFAGLLLPLLTLCYVNWGAGGLFFSPLIQVGDKFLTVVRPELFSGMTHASLYLAGALALLDLFALVVFFSDLYAVGSKPRTILIYNIGVLLLTTVLVFGPSATPAIFWLAAVPSAVLLPVLFVRTHPRIILPVYLLLLAAAFYNAIIQ